MAVDLRDRQPNVPQNKSFLVSYSYMCGQTGQERRRSYVAKGKTESQALGDFMRVIGDRVDVLAPHVNTVFEIEGANETV